MIVNFQQRTLNTCIGIGTICVSLVTGCYANRSAYHADGDELLDTASTNSSDPATTSPYSIDASDDAATKEHPVDSSDDTNLGRPDSDITDAGTEAEIGDERLVCGDGRVGDAEACDVAIETGQPGACPKSAEDCPPGDVCVIWILNGKPDCAAACVGYTPTCNDGDGCCPTNCDSSSDSDCSSS